MQFGNDDRPVRPADELEEVAFVFDYIGTLGNHRIFVDLDLTVHDFDRLTKRAMKHR